MLKCVRLLDVFLVVLFLGLIGIMSCTGVYILCFVAVCLEMAFYLCHVLFVLVCEYVSVLLCEVLKLL